MILLFGGSFDPPHIAHVRMAAGAVEALSPDRLLVIPAAQPPHKSAQRTCSDPHRLAMCRLAFADVPTAQVCDVEFSLPGPSYTVRTLEVLAQQFPDTEFCLLMGADMFQTFHQWKDAARILALCRIAVIARDGAVGGGPFIPHIVLDISVPAVSSTAVRLALTEGRMADAQKLLSPAVYDYILSRKLYRERMVTPNPPYES